MTNPRSARTALAIVQCLAHRNEALAGDLVEEFHSRQSASWLWGQLLLAVAMGAFRAPNVPVALNLTPVDPVVAEWLMDRKLGRNTKHVSLTGTSIEGIGGLTLMTLGFLMSAVLPVMWVFVLGGLASGLGLGAAKVMTRRHKGLPETHLILN